MKKEPQEVLLPKRKRGRPATALARSEYLPNQPTHLSENEGRVSSAFSLLLRMLLHQDRAQLLRVAKELGVSENTIYRWMNGSTEPRIYHLNRLPDAMPEYRDALIEAINKTFHNILSLQGKYSRHVNERIEAVPKEIYQRVTELITLNDGTDPCLWEVAQAIFEHILYHLDHDHLGLAVSYAHLLPPHEDGIHSLREAIVRCHEPWPLTTESKVYLGSTSLAGAVATLQRMQVWDGSESRLQAEVDEYEKSACAVPVVRGSRIAGVLIVSSTDVEFFRQPMACQAVSEYAQLLGLALREQNFFSFSLLRLRPMPTLSWQREQLLQNYVPRVIQYARDHRCSRQEAEQVVQKEFECEFEGFYQEQSLALGKRQVLGSIDKQRQTSWLDLGS